MVGVFDLGARTFEGIRNASRIDEDDEEGDEGDDGRQRAQDPDRSNQRESPASPKSPMGTIREGTSLDVAGGVGVGWGGGAGAGTVGLLSLRARPPRMFGPLGEMDPFTWDSAVAQAILRAVMRDDSDVPVER